MVSEDLLTILRCPHCVTGPTRKAGDDPGQVTLAHEAWLVCQEPDCGRKYPITRNIPDLRIDTGDKWIATPVADLPVPPPPA